MARKESKTEAKGVVITDADTPGLPAMVAAANAQAGHSQAISDQLGFHLPYERERVVNEAHFFMAQSAESMLEAGKRLILIKENEAHGEFIEIVEGRLGLGKRTAQVMMQAAVKYLSPQLQSKAHALALLGKKKLFELMIEDDDDLVALAEGGTVAGLTLDDIDRMTTRELRAALRDANETASAKDKLLSDKSAKIDELATKLTTKEKRVKTPPPDEVAADIRKEADLFAFRAEHAISRELRPAFQALIEHAAENGGNHAEFMLGLITQVEYATNQLRAEFGLLKAKPDGDITPDWLREDSLVKLQADAEKLKPEWMRDLEAKNA